MSTPRARKRLWPIPLSTWPRLARQVAREAAHDRITMIAASLAFHGFLALLPVLLATVALLGLVGLSGDALHHLVHATRVLLPSQMSDILNQQLLKPSRRPVSVLEVSLGLLVALWSSVEAMAALQVALDQAYETPLDRGLVGRRLVALPLIGLTLVLGGVASVLLVLGGPIGRLLPSGFHDALVILRYGGSLVLLILMLSAYYSFGPARETVRWEWISPGGVAAAVGWLISSLAFSFYLDHFGHESRTYGALAGVAVTLLWMFLTAIVVLLGAELNRELERAEERAELPAPADE
ncbi:MAG: YihY/virulence factor BrkB family protein [Actinomycetota bacterium]|nr:YihY/virulence factor BrkB family protein [Actinomycetota bacterium]